MDSPGSIRVPSVGHHLWKLPVRRRKPLSRGPRGAFNRTARVFLHQIRWRPGPPEYGLRAAAVVGSILLHFVVMVSFILMRPGFYEPPATTADANAIDVRLVDKEPPPPPPPPPPKLRHQHVRKTQPMQTHAVTTVSPPAVTAPAIEVQPLPPPVISLQQPKPEIATPPGVPQPPQRPQASPPLPDMPTPQAPPPPRIVLEPSKMAVPPPPIEVAQIEVSTVPSTRLQPVPVVAPIQSEQVAAPQLDVVVDAPLPASLQPVTRSVEIPLTPAVAPVPLPNVAPPEVTLDSAPPPPSVPLSVPQPTPLVHAQIAVTSPPVQVAVTPASTPAMQAAQASPTPAATPSTAADAQADSNAAEPSTADSAAPTSAADNTPWANANDQFGKLPSTAKNGRLAPRQGQGKGAGKGKQGDLAGSYIQLYPRGNSDVMGRSSNQLGYTPTIFDQYWAPDNEDALTSWLRHIVEKLTVKHTFDLGRGIHVHCALGPMAVFLGCGGDPPPPPSVKSGDPRLNLAPANPLVPNLEPPTSAPSSAPQSTHDQVACSMARVAGAPPPPGCKDAPVQPSKSDQWQ